ncbi:MAG TPA: hypothetical protein VHH12_00965 [Mycobacterium sp.]|nr:hypothetical protein [Mycobacterium sp.]
MAVDPAGTRVYVTNSGSDSVSVIDTASNEVTATIPVGDSPTAVAVTAEATRSLPAVVRSSTTWLLRDSLSSGEATHTFGYGARPLVAIMGDWDGDGTRTAGTYEAGVFKLNNANDSSEPDITFAFGDRRGFPVAGDWDGDGSDDVVVYRNGLWQLRLSSGETRSFTYGSGNWPATVPVSGDWDGDGSDEIGTYTYASATWALRNSATSGPPDAGTFGFGTPNSSYPVPGDWDADATDTVAVKSGETWTLRNTNSAGLPDETFEFGAVNDLPLTWRTATPPELQAPSR